MTNTEIIATAVAAAIGGVATVVAAALRRRGASRVLVVALAKNTESNARLAAKVEALTTRFDHLVTFVAGSLAATTPLLPTTLPLPSTAEAAIAEATRAEGSG